MNQEQQVIDFNNISIRVEPNPDLGTNLAKITLVGIGGGCNMIDNYLEKNQYKMKVIASNTDNQVLQNTLAPKKIQLGVKTTRGLGAGMNPEVGRTSAEESYDEILGELNGSDLIFLCAGLGGGTGSGAIPIFARAAKELGILCVAVVTMPFDFEIGRDVIADEALKNVKQYIDSHIVIYNDKILNIVPPQTGMEESFKIIDNVLFDTVHSICEMILNFQRKNMNVDFADISTTLTGKGLALIGIGNQTGENAGVKALEDAIKSPLLNIESIHNAKSILIHIKSNPNYPIHETQKLMQFIKTNADLGAKCIVGTIWDPEMKEDKVKITLIATGFKTTNIKQDPLVIEETVDKPISLKDKFMNFLNKWL